MISALHILQESIATHLGSDGSISTVERISMFTSEIEKIFSDMLKNYSQYTSLEMAIISCTHSYQLLIHLEDQLLLEQGEADDYFIIVHQFTIQFEHYFNHLLNNEQPLSIYSQQTLEKQVLEKYNKLKPLFTNKQIPGAYILEVQNAFISLFQQGKLPEIKYYHREYLQKLMEALDQLAKDNRKKDWPLRFLFLLVKYNFNYIGLFNRWTEELQKQLDTSSNIEEAYIHLVDLQFTFSVSYTLDNYAFDKQSKNLRKRILDYLQNEINARQAAYEIVQSQHYGAIPSNLNAHELAIMFHYTFIAGFLAPKTKKEAAEVFSANIVTKTGIRVSTNTLRKLDKKEFTAAAYTIYKKLLQIIQQLKRDFDL